MLCPVFRELKIISLVVQLDFSLITHFFRLGNKSWAILVGLVLYHKILVSLIQER